METPSNVDDRQVTAVAASAAGRPTISLVVPAHREEGNLHELYRRIDGAVDEDWELIVVDDGSPDATWEVIRELQAQDSRVNGLRLSRNFGHQNAILAGLSVARGQAVVMMDADLQHPPEVIGELIQRWRDGAQIVNTERKDAASISASKKWSSRLYYRVFSFLSGVEMKPGQADFRLLDRVVVDELLRLREGGLFLRGLVHWVGYESTTVPFECGERFAGETSYGLRKMLSLGWSGITSFSLVPLRATILIGLLASLVAAYQFVDALYVALFTDGAVPGWASTVGLMSLLFAVLFVQLGMLGEYLARILEETRSRPRFIVRERSGVRGVAEDTARRGEAS